MRSHQVCCLCYIVALSLFSLMILRNIINFSNRRAMSKMEQTLSNLTANTADEVEGWERNVDRDTRHYVEQYTDTNKISGQDICKPGTDIVIIVMTLPAKFTHRLLIRETWASRKLRGVAVGFFVGVTATPFVQENIHRENDKYQDVVQEGFIDTHHNSTLKTVFLLKWFLRNCPSSKFLVKVEGDTFVDPLSLAEHIAKLPSGTLGGFPMLTRKVDRNRASKRYTPVYMYPKNNFPRFLSGAGYFMSRDVAAKLYGASLTTPILHLEDVYVTGLCAEKAEVQPKFFEYAKHVTKQAQGCPAFYDMCHSLNPDSIQRTWKKRL